MREAHGVAESKDPCASSPHKLPQGILPTLSPRRLYSLRFISISPLGALPPDEHTGKHRYI
jgi:hypothetical protein